MIDDTRRPWTPDEDRQLLAMRGRGCIYRDVAQALGRTPGACRRRMTEHTGGAEATDPHTEAPRTKQRDIAGRRQASGWRWAANARRLR